MSTPHTTHGTDDTDRTTTCERCGRDRPADLQGDPETTLDDMDAEADAKRVAVRLTPHALQELYIESKNLSPDARQAGHTAECDLCGEQGH